MKRRNFIQTIPALGLASTVTLDQKNVPIKEGLTILFQGDSITDAGRSRGHYYANNSAGMGNGYVILAASQLHFRYPEHNFQIYNRGISGHKVFQLRDRWKEDCLQLKPDVLSILIGVNDYWHTLTHNYQGDAAMYAGDFRKLLDNTLEEFPNLKLIIGEPFTAEGGTAIGKFNTATFDQYRYASKSIAKEYKAHFLPYHAKFNKAVQKNGAAHWCPDGVHPSMAGNQLMANMWIDTFEKLF